MDVHRLFVQNKLKNRQGRTGSTFLKNKDMVEQGGYILKITT